MPHLPLWERMRKTGDLAAALAEFAAIPELPDFVCGAPAYRAGDRLVPRWKGEHVRRLLVATPPDHAMPDSLDGLAELQRDGGFWERESYGDRFLFLRYLPAARKFCEHLSVTLPRSLHPIALRAGANAVYESAHFAHAASEADAYIPASWDLVISSGEDFGRPFAIAPLGELVPKLAGDRLHVGLCWAGSGNPDLCDDNGRDFRSDGVDLMLRPLRHIEGIELHSLQAGDAGATAPSWMRRHDLTTWDRTIALISALDLVITVDTSIAHLAAGMTETYVILRDLEAWQWGVGDASPWYPLARVFRGDPVEIALDLLAAVRVDAVIKAFGKVSPLYSL